MRRSHRMWLVFAGGPLAVLLVLLLSLIIVIACAGDLEPGRSMARAAGIPATRAELGLPERTDYNQWLGNSEALRRRVEHTTKAIGWGDLPHDDPNRLLGYTSIRDPGVPIPAEWAQAVAEIPPELFADIDAALADATARPPRFAVADTPWGWGMTTYSFRKLGSDISLTMACGEADQMPARAARAFACLDCMPPDGLTAYMARMHSGGNIIGLLRGRLPVWPKPDATTAGILRAHANGLEAIFRTALEREVVALGENLVMDPEAWAKNLGIALPRIYEYRFGMVAHNRWSRALLYERYIQQVIAVRGVPDPGMALNWRSPMRAPSPDLAVLLGEIMHVSSQRLPLLWQQTLRHRCALLAVAAHLDGGDMPVDPCDPTGGRLRSAVFDGREVGVYSVGPNGLDEGGFGDDWTIPMQAPWPAKKP